MKIIQKVLIKQVITEKSKNKLHASFSQDIMRLEQECQQLLFEQKKLKARSRYNQETVKQRFTEEINQRKEKIKLLKFKKEQLDLLDIGSEIIESEVEALVEVVEGMNWAEFQREKTIVIEDGIVVRIES